MTPTPVPTPPSVPPELTVHTVSDPSFFTAYGPVLAGTLALIGALVTVVVAGHRQKREIEAAEDRRKKDAEAAEARRRADQDAIEARWRTDQEAADQRERARHRRDNALVKVSDLIGTAIGVHKLARMTKGYREFLASAPPDEPLENLRHELDGYSDSLTDSLDKLASLNHQVQLLSPPKQLTEALDKLVFAAIQLSRSAGIAGQPTELVRRLREVSSDGIPPFEQAATELNSAAKKAVEAFRASFGEEGTAPALPAGT